MFCSKHENSEINIICSEKKCDFSRFFCINCLLNDENHYNLHRKKICSFKDFIEGISKKDHCAEKIKILKRNISEIKKILSCKLTKMKRIIDKIENFFFEKKIEIIQKTENFLINIIEHEEFIANKYSKGKNIEENKENGINFSKIQNKSYKEIVSFLENIINNENFCLNSEIDDSILKTQTFLKSLQIYTPHKFYDHQMVEFKNIIEKNLEDLREYFFINTQNNIINENEVFFNY